MRTLTAILVCLFILGVCTVDAAGRKASARKHVLATNKTATKAKTQAQLAAEVHAQMRTFFDVALSAYPCEGTFGSSFLEGASEQYQGVDLDLRPLFRGAAEWFEQLQIDSSARPLSPILRSAADGTFNGPTSIDLRPPIDIPYVGDARGLIVHKLDFSLDPAGVRFAAQLEIVLKAKILGETKILMTLDPYTMSISNLRMPKVSFTTNSWVISGVQLFANSYITKLVGQKIMELSVYMHKCVLGQTSVQSLVAAAASETVNPLRVVLSPRKFWMQPHSVVDLVVQGAKIIFDTMVQATPEYAAENFESCDATPHGRCINTDTETCSDASVLLTGLCAGPAHIKCCVPNSLDSKITEYAEDLLTKLKSSKQRLPAPRVSGATSVNSPDWSRERGAVVLEHPMGLAAARLEYFEANIAPSDNLGTTIDIKAWIQLLLEVPLIGPVVASIDISDWQLSERNLEALPQVHVHLANEGSNRGIDVTTDADISVVNVLEGGEAAIDWNRIGQIEGAAPKCDAVEGICKDSTTHGCHGGEFQRGLCPGSIDIKCCVGGDYSSKYEEMAQEHLDGLRNKLDQAIAKLYDKTASIWPLINNLHTHLGEENPIVVQAAIASSAPKVAMNPKLSELVRGTIIVVLGHLLSMYEASAKN